MIFALKGYYGSLLLFGCFYTVNMQKTSCCFFASKNEGNKRGRNYIWFKREIPSFPFWCGIRNYIISTIQ